MVLIIPQGFLFRDEQVSLDMCLETLNARLSPEGFKRGIFELSCDDPQSPILRNIQLSDMTCITLLSLASIVHLALDHTMIHSDSAGVKTDKSKTSQLASGPLGCIQEVGQRPSEAMETTVVLDRGNFPESSTMETLSPKGGHKYGHFMVTGDGKSSGFSLQCQTTNSMQFRVFGAREIVSSAYLLGSQTLRWKTSATLWRC